MNGLLKSYQMLAIILVLTASAASAQDDGFIYGKVTTIDGNEYMGALRWGKEEAYWTDMFNGTKTENNNIDLLSREELAYLEDRERNRYVNRNDSWINVRWSEWDYDDDFIHQFVVQFGEIKSIRPRGRDWVDVELQNGDTYEIDGSGTNDVGGKVRVNDNELGMIELNFSRIERIEFMATPRKLDEKFGEPLYGTVETDLGRFTGFVQWDHDERVSTDKLDGDTYDGDVSIDFGKIKSIERMGYSRSMIVLNSGRELELRGSNDVNDENRGIIVTVAGMGRVDIPWKDFDKVTFEEAPNSGPDYDSFKDQKKLKGQVVTTNGDTHSGEVIFDLDESWNYEVIDGKDDDAEFIIPLRNVASISPRNYAFSYVTLKNGEKLLLGDTHDVSDENNGVLIRAGGDPVYVPWEKVEEIKLE